MRHQHAWQVEPVTQSRPRWPTDEIDGELYTPDCRRGDLKATCSDRACGTSRLFHPFSGGAEIQGATAPAFDLALYVKDIGPGEL